MTAALGWIGSALVVISLVQTDLRRLRQIGLLSAIVLGAFNLMVAIPSMIALNAVLAVVNSYHLLPTRRLITTPRAEASEQSVSDEGIDAIHELGRAGSAALNR
jgi:hypothetical protein